MKTPKNLEECTKIAWCFECIYNDLKEEGTLGMCSTRKEFKTGINPIFFLNFDPPI